MKMIAGTTLFSLALVASACGGSSSQPAASAAATQAAATAATTAPTTAPTVAPSANPDQSILDLLKSGKPTTYKVTYTLTQTSKGKTNTGTMGEAWKPPFHRIEIGISEGGVTQNTIVITRPEGTFICGALFGPAPSCFASPTSGGAGAPILGAVPQTIPTELAGWAIVPTAGRNIAGTDTRCFNFTSPAGTTKAGTGTACFTPQGIPLFWGGTDTSGDVSMTATAFSTNVTDADFALPYPVTKLPGQP
jgi:hypothetical protein